MRRMKLAVAWWLVLLATGAIVQPGRAQSSSDPAPAVESAPEPGTVDAGSAEAGPDHAATAADSEGQMRFVTPGPGGGALEISAGPGSVLGKDEFLLQGYVDIKYGSLRLQADFVRYVPSTRQVFAEGNVIVDQGTARITAESVVYNLESDTGTFLDARGFAEPSIHFVAARVEKISVDEFMLYDARFTACTQPIPYWSFKLRKGLLRLGDYAYLHDLSFRIGRVPVFYSPYLVWPIKTERASGLLFPQFGFSDRSGTIISQAYYWAMRRNMDATFYLDYMSKAGYGTGLDYRYVPSENGAGRFTGYFIHDQVAKDENRPGIPVDRWVIDYEHRQDLGSDWRFSANANFISDFDYYQDFSRDIRLSSSPQAVSDLFLTRNWGFYSLNLQAERREQLVQALVIPTSYGAPFSATLDETIVRWIQPEAEFRSRRQRLGGLPLYLTLISSFDSFDKGEENASYQRVDAFPTLSAQLSPATWLDVDVSAGFRNTYYTKSQRFDLGCDNIPDTGDFGEGNGDLLDREDDRGGTCTAGICSVGLVGDVCVVDSDCGMLGVFGPEDDFGCDNIRNPLSPDFGEGNGRRDMERTVVVDEALNRNFYEGGLTVIGPKLSRVFATPESRFSPRFKHTFEPTIRYTVQSQIDNPGQVIQFDEIDRAVGDVNQVTYSLVTRLFAKRPSTSFDPTSAGLPPADVQFIGGTSDPLAGLQEEFRREIEREEDARRVGDPDDGDGSAVAEPQLSTVEVATLEISQAYSFLRPLSVSSALMEQRQVSPIRGTLRFNPSINTSVDVRTSFDVLFNQIRDASLSANLRSPRRGFVNFTWSLVRDLEGRSLFAQALALNSPFDRNQIGLNGETQLFGSRLLLGLQFNYELGDVQPGQPRLRDQRYKLGYNTQCCGFQFEYMDRQYIGSSQREFRFLVNLRGVGNVVDLHSSVGSGGF